MSDAPRVSFLVPCFNQGRFLDEAIDSVLAQTCQDFEVLVVDDGSTDEETRRVLTSHERPRTTLLRSENRGLAGARNLALAHARGEFISALDADDRLAPRFLEAMLAAFDADPGLTFCSAWQRIFGDEEWEWRQEHCDLPALLAENTVLPASLVRREAVVAAGGWDPAMPSPGYEDWDLWISLVERGRRGTILPEVLFHYRRHAATMSAAIAVDRERHLALVRYLLDKHAASYREHLWEAYDLMQERGARSLRGIYDGERWLAAWVEPQAADLRAELVRLRARLAHVRGAAPTDAARGQTSRADALQSDAARDHSQQSNSAAAGARAARDDSSRADSAPAAAHLAELETALAAAYREVAELRASHSWRVTAPLRAIYGRLLALKAETPQ